MCVYLNDTHHNSNLTGMDSYNYKNSRNTVMFHAKNICTAVHSYRQELQLNTYLVLPDYDLDEPKHASENNV
jgi:hypothetical protein